MKTLSLRLLTLVLFTAGSAFAGDDDTTLNQISGYRQWTRVNQQPVMVPVVVSGLDAAAV